MKLPAVYIMANKKNGTLYTRMTSNLMQRVYQHKNKMVEGFSSKYHCPMLVYFEQFDEMEQAIMREKQIKAGSRKKKIALIESINKSWQDLYAQIV